MLKITKKFIGMCLAGAVISWKMVLSTGTRVLKASNCNSLTEFVESVILTDMEARSVLETID